MASFKRTMELDKSGATTGFVRQSLLPTQLRAATHGIVVMLLAVLVTISHLVTLRSNRRLIP